MNPTIKNIETAINRGESIESISKRHGIPEQDIKNIFKHIIDWSKKKTGKNTRQKE